MSVTALSSDSNKLHKISSQLRKNSGEIDVFEAARYFSGANEHRRMSLDVSIPPRIQPIMEKDQTKEKNNKKFKQPSSPGGKIASFLNSLFNQTSSKKKTKSKSKTKDVDEDCNGERRKRRSSISHFRITTLTTNASAEYSSSASGFRTPPAYATTPSKSYKDFRIFADQKKVVSLPHYTNRDYVESKQQNEQKRVEVNSLDKKSGLKNNGISQKNAKKVTSGFEEMEVRKYSDFDDGNESDSSSDLFDLPNLDLDFYPTGLPLYETTNMDRIKIGKPFPSTTYSH